jgi:hypothetical protein
VRKINLIAMLLIAACAISTRAIAEKVYKSGGTYAEIPCPDAVTIDADDTRSKAQKIQSENNVKRDTATANAMEKARLKKETLVTAQNKVEAKTSGKKPVKVKTKPIPGKNKKINKKKGPELFTAATPVEPKTPKKKDAAATTQ